MLQPGTFTVSLPSGPCYQSPGVSSSFVRRIDGTVLFDRTWIYYKNGFGNPSTEFWLGLDALNNLTSSGERSLRVDIEDWNGNTYCAMYKTFIVGPESDNYRLTISGYDDVYSTGGDSMTPDGNTRNLDGQEFSTYDKDNDEWSGKCSAKFGGNGGWWFNECSWGKATGTYFSNEENPSGVNWKQAKGNNLSYKYMQMSVRTNH